MTTRETEWDDDSRDAALALAVYEESLCPSCGQPSHICQDAARQFDWTALAPVRCHATTALLNRQKAFTEETHSPVGALLFSVHLNDETGS